MPHPIVARNRRLFDQDPIFAKAMESKLDAVVSICSGWSDRAGIAQGYTYLGQFLVHDIISREQPRTPTSNRSRKLDLDSVYGEPAKFDDLGCFLYSGESALYTNDLLRDSTTKAALIPEFRNDEHPIISQLHLTIQLFHNAVIDAIRASVEGAKLSHSELFETARSYVIATVQRIYDEDYLGTISDPIIHRAHRAVRLKVFDIPESECQLPFEMTHASLRFGHSQIRESYLLNEKETLTELKDLFHLSGHLNGATFKGIPKDKRIDWRRFFPWRDRRDGIDVDLGRRINPNIADAMALLLEPPIPHIVKRNVEAGIRTLLPSGQTIAKRLHEMKIDARIAPTLQLQPDDAKQEAQLRDHGLWNATPLWLFVLIEAAALGGDGRRLGPLGSVFLCETIRSALAGQDCYRNVQAYCEQEFGLKQLGTFEQLARFSDPTRYGDP